METIYLDDFLTDGMIKEKDFRVLIKEFDWTIYQNKKVMIKGCTSVPVPTWAYLIITANLVKFSNQILYGEPCSAVKIYNKNE